MFAFCVVLPWVQEDNQGLAESRCQPSRGQPPRGQPPRGQFFEASLLETSLLEAGLLEDSFLEASFFEDSLLLFAPINVSFPRGSTNSVTYLGMLCCVWKVDSHSAETSHLKGPKGIFLPWELRALNHGRTLKASRVYFFVIMKADCSRTKEPPRDDGAKRASVLFGSLEGM